MAQAGNKTCEICVRALGLHYCSQCDQVFCDDCKMSHLRSKISRNHTFLSGSKTGGCTDHNKDFIYLCKDCDQLICRLCVTKAHKKHAVVDINDSNKEVQDEISQYLNSKVNNVRLSAQLIEERAKTYKPEVDQTVKDIITHGNHIKEIVDEKVDSLIKALRERESIELQSLSKAHADCEDLLEEATRHQQIYQDVIKECDEVALFQRMKKLKSDIYNMKSVDGTRLPSATYDMESVQLLEVEKLFGTLTCQETEIADKNIKLSTVPHDLPQQTKKSKRRDQPTKTKGTEIAVKNMTLSFVPHDLSQQTKQSKQRDQPTKSKIKTEQDLKRKMSGIVKWTNDQAQSEVKEIELHQDTNRQLEILKKEQAIKDGKIKQLEALNKDLQQRLQGKTNLKKLETECNKLKEEQVKLQNQRKQDVEQYHKLCKENKELQEGLQTAGEVIHESQKKVADLENEVSGLKVTTEENEHAIKALREEKDDFLNRLSSLVGDKLTKGNPDITDLGDPNRPMKIAEKYGGLYDNEWTDAMQYSDDAMRTLFPAVDHQPFDEILIYHLHRLVMCCYRECLKLSTEQEQTIRSAVINPMKLQIDADGTDVNNMPGYREIVNVRRQNALQFADTLFQNKMISMKSIITDWDYIYKNEELIGQLLGTPFFKKCVHLCWYMAIQDPVMYLSEEIKPDTVYNRDVYKEFVQSGDKVKYVVWPALFLHEGGPLLYKGVVQPYK